MIEKGQQFAFWQDAVPQDAGNGLTRRVMAYNEEIMTVENSFAKGAIAPLHSHVHTQIAYVVEGIFDFEIAGEVRRVKKGDSMMLASNVPHGCKCLEAGIVLDVFTPMRKDFV
ncbi:MAG: cupin domain-containing protein [Oscillospiraceae bacterium]|nr:cupin domain-containing protein [Oscillospiraceae bacterium]